MTIYLIQMRQRLQTGKWSKWTLRDQWYTKYRPARRDQDMINGDGWEARVVRFVPKRPKNMWQYVQWARGKGH